MPEVSRYEPRQALDGGPDGLDAYRAIGAAALKLLAPGGHLLVEVGLDGEPREQRLEQRIGVDVDARRGLVSLGNAHND